MNKGEMVMKRLVVAAGVGIAVMCASFAVAKPSDSVERSPKMVSDAVKDDVRIAAAGDTSAKDAAPQRLHRVRSRRRPHMHAMPRGKSERNIRLRQQQQKSN